jgi:hypothetical protein
MLMACILRVPLGILTEAVTNIIEILCDFSHQLQTYSFITPYIRPRPLHYTSFPIRCSRHPITLHSKVYVINRNFTSTTKNTEVYRAFSVSVRQYGRIMPFNRPRLDCSKSASYLLFRTFHFIQ